MAHYTSEYPRGTYYVYTLAYPDGKVFYVGKGRDARLDDHEREARKDSRSHKCNVIRKIWASGGQVLKTKLAYFETSKDACMYEIALIFFMDGLTNRTYGGEGIRGLPRTAVHQQKIADAKRGQKASEETKRKMSEARKGQKPTEDALRKRGLGLKTSSRAQEQRRKLHIASKGRTSTNKGKKGHSPSEETRQKISDAAKRQWQEQRDKMVQSLKGKNKGQVAWNKGTKLSVEYRQKLSDAHKGKPWSEKRRAAQ